MDLRRVPAPRGMMVNVPGGVPPIVESAMAFLQFYDERRCPTWLAAWGQAEGVGGGSPGIPADVKNMLAPRDAANPQEDMVRKAALKVMLNYFSGEQEYAPVLPQGVKDMMSQGEEHDDVPHHVRVPAGVGGYDGPLADTPLSEMGFSDEILDEMARQGAAPRTPDEWLDFWAAYKVGLGNGPLTDLDDEDSDDA